MLTLSKKKNKGPAKPRNNGQRIKSFAALQQNVINEEILDLEYPTRADFDNTKFNCETKFLNCYNFIPLPQKECVRSKKEVGNLTGKIHCTIKPKTDIFIPNTSNTSCTTDSPKGETVREFFSYTNLKDGYKMNDHNAPQNPVIPGSEIRGMIRSMYEAFTNSCMSALDFNKELSSRVSDPFSAGMLIFKDQKWELYSADRYNINPEKVKFPQSQNFCVKTDKNGKRYIKDDNGKAVYSYDSVKFSGSKFVTSISDNGTKEGYVIIGEPFGNKKSEFIFTKKEKDTPIFDNDNNNNNEILLDAIRRYNVIIKDFYRDSKANKTSEKTRTVSDFYKGREITENPEENTNIPVWYNKIKDKSGNVYLYLSPACIGREIFMNDFLKFTHGYEPCQGNELCPCCKLFGMVGDDNAAGSRLRFSDAKFIGTKPKYRPITTLKELSTPKPTSMEMYTHVKNIKNIKDNKEHEFWNYDIYTFDYGNNKNTKNSKNSKIVLPATENIEINGRKMYYHHPACNDNTYYAYTPDKLIPKNRQRLVTVRPLQGTESNKFEKSQSENEKVSESLQETESNEFEFDIFFEHITGNELKMLLIVTSLLFNRSDYCYKIGMGKPIGLGSIKISVDKVMLRKIEMTDSGISYEYESTNDYKDYYYYDDTSRETAEKTVIDFLKEEKVVQSVFDQIKKMTYFNYTDKNHSPQYPQPATSTEYPQPAKSTEVFKWFSNNRILGKNCEFKQVLDESGILKENKENEKGRKDKKEKKDKQKR